MAAYGANYSVNREDFVSSYVQVNIRRNHTGFLYKFKIGQMHTLGGKFLRDQEGIRRIMGAILRL